jgi:hypothetical protein
VTSCIVQIVLVLSILPRPKENHVFDVLHWVKTAFKKHALDQIKESDCLNKEAYRSAFLSYLVSSVSSHSRVTHRRSGYIMILRSLLPR